MEELTPKVIPVLTETGEPYDLSNLDYLGMRMNALQKKMEHLKAPLPENECMCEFCNSGRLSQKFGEIAIQMGIQTKNIHDQLLAQAAQIVEQSKNIKIKFTGIGTFIFQKDKPALDYSEYEALTQKEKDEFYRNNAELYRKIEKIELDKAQLNEIILKQGGEVQFFSIKPQSNTFRFKK